MLKRSISARQLRWLQEELEAWRAEALLSEDQAQRILDVYEAPAELAEQQQSRAAALPRQAAAWATPEEQSQRILDLYEASEELVERQRSRAVFTLMAVAGTLVGLAVLLLIGYNWEAMPSALKLVILFGAIVGTHAAGFHLRYARKALLGSEIVFFIGCLFYGAGIWLVAQIFHLSAHYPDGMWWWAVGVLPFALCLDTVLLHALLVALVGVWAGMEVLGFSDLGAWFFGRWRALPNGAYTLPLLALPGMIWAYRKASLAAIGLYTPLLAGWACLQLVAWRVENPIYFIGSTGALLLLVAEIHPVGSRFAIPYRYWGTLLSGAVLVLLSFHEFNKDMLRSEPAAGGVAQMAAIVVLAALVLASAWAVQRSVLGPTTVLPDQLAELVRRQWLPVGLIALMLLLAFWDATVRQVAQEAPALATIVPTVLANIAMIGSGLWLITVGLREDRGRPFAAGVLYFLLWAALRYVDLFGEFGGMLGASLMFFLCGATLFGVALYWRQRKGASHV